MKRSSLKPISERFLGFSKFKFRLLFGSYLITPGTSTRFRAYGLGQEEPCQRGQGCSARMARQAEDLRLVGLVQEILCKGFFKGFQSKECFTRLFMRVVLGFCKGVDRVLSGA